LLLHQVERVPGLALPQGVTDRLSHLGGQHAPVASHSATFPAGALPEKPHGLGMFRAEDLEPPAAHNSDISLQHRSDRFTVAEAFRLKSPRIYFPITV